MVVDINDHEKLTKLMDHLEDLKSYHRIDYPFTSFKQLSKILLVNITLYLLSNKTLYAS